MGARDTAFGLEGASILEKMLFNSCTLSLLGPKRLGATGSPELAG